LLINLIWLKKFFQPLDRQILSSLNFAIQINVRAGQNGASGLNVVQARVRQNKIGSDLGDDNLAVFSHFLVKFLRNWLKQTKNLSWFSGVIFMIIRKNSTWKSLTIVIPTRSTCKFEESRVNKISDSIGSFYPSDLICSQFHFRSADPRFKLWQWRKYSEEKVF
jgi:hypothetical protein